jgi:hypothetical protein
MAIEKLNPMMRRGNVKAPATIRSRSWRASSARFGFLLRNKSPIRAESDITKKERAETAAGYFAKLSIDFDLEPSFVTVQQLAGKSPFQ